MSLGSSMPSAAKEEETARRRLIRTTSNLIKTMVIVISNAHTYDVQSRIALPHVQTNASLECTEPISYRIVSVTTRI